MSAFVVSKNHINALVNFARQCNMAFNFEDEILYTRSFDDCQKIVAILEKANVDSVNARYYENETELIYQFKLLSKKYSPIQIIKACQCLDYQCCEVDNWTTQENFACRIIEWIKDEAIRHLADYDNLDWAIR